MTNINYLQAKVSTCDLSIPRVLIYKMIYSDQKAAQECYFATIKELEEDYEEHSKTPK